MYALTTAGPIDGERPSATAAERWIMGITVIAALVRIWTAATYFDTPGDGPSRAGIAYAWGMAPYLPTCGGWPPGHMFVAGIWSWVVPTPRWSSRVLNIVLGFAFGSCALWHCDFDMGPTDWSLGGSDFLRVLPVLLKTRGILIFNDNLDHFPLHVSRLSSLVHHLSGQPSTGALLRWTAGRVVLMSLATVVLAAGTLRLDLELRAARRRLRT